MYVLLCKVWFSSFSCQEQVIKNTQINFRSGTGCQTYWSNFKTKKFFKGPILKQMLYFQSTTVNVPIKGNNGIYHILFYSFKDMQWNWSRTGYASHALSQDQGIILKLFLVRNRVRLLVPQQRIPTLKFGEYLPPRLKPLKRSTNYRKWLT